MRRTSFVVAFAAAVVALPLSAQTWQAIGTPSNSGTGAYWNNVSDDNVGSAVCNIGGVLTNTPGLTAGSCVNQAPTYLPLNPAPLTTSSFFLGGAGGANPGAFRFNCVTCSVSRIGRIAGDPSSSWGVITDAGLVITAAQLASGTTVSGNFAVWITQQLPAAGLGTVHSSTQQTGVGAIAGRASTINQQMAVFGAMMGSLSTDTFGTIIAVGANSRYFVGMEDNINGGRGFGASVPGAISDRDYNDILISIQAVPEPATIGLMGFGLLALAGFAKRRKA